MRLSWVVAWVVAWAVGLLSAMAWGGLPVFAVGFAAFALASTAVILWQERRGR